jgi:FixJ family two-component response regulator
VCRAPRSIAVVDDDAAVRKAMVRLLRAAGFNPRGFGSGQEFLQSWLTDRPDCLVLDLQMPGLAGSEVQRTLRLAAAHLPTIVITAHDEPGTRAECMELGAIAYLLKPLDQQALLEALNRALVSSD